MTCQCSCTGFAYGVSNIVPWVCNQFQQIPPTICSPPCSQMSCSSSVKQDRLVIFASAISVTYQALRQACLDYPQTCIVLAAQKARLLLALTTYNTTPSDPLVVFERDDLLQDIRDLTTGALNDLYLIATYPTIVSLRDAYYQAIDDYFQCVATAR